jgi:protein gp37
MGANTKIQWCDHTWNPWHGCTMVSPGCANCYAEQQNKLPVRVRWGRGEVRYRSSETYLTAPARWNTDSERAVAKGGRRLRIFCASNADILDPEVHEFDPSWQVDLWGMVEQTPHLDWLLLTKRPEQAKRLLPKAWLHGAWPVNAWFGVSVEDQTLADRRIPKLLELPAPIKFLSCEPLLGPVDLQPWLSKLQWVIVGGESGPKARPMHPRWARSLRDQCQSEQSWTCTHFCKFKIHRLLQLSLVGVRGTNAAGHGSYYESRF